MRQSDLENLFQKDKLIHYFIGSVLACLGFILGGHWCITIPFIVGFTKELFDYYIRKTGFSISDLLWTVSNGILLYITKLI